MNTKHMQIDTKWKNTMYSILNDPNQTIGTSGCGPTSMSSLVSSILKKEILPPELCDYAVKNGYRTANNGTAYAFFEAYGKTVGLNIHQVDKSNKERILNALLQGKLVICSMGPGNWTSSGHFVVAYGLEGSNVLIHDPNSYREDRLKASIDLWQSQVKWYFVCEESAIERSENYKKLQEKYGFSDETMYHLASYRYAEELYIKLFNKEKIEKETFDFILIYQFGYDIIRRVYMDV